MMEKEISILQEQLLEALDWKLMHEDPISSGQGQNMQQDALTKENIFLEDEVDSSKLEKQIETVGAVASMQAELIAMRDTVAAAKRGETEAQEQVSSLIAEVEGLQRGLRDLQEENANSDVKKVVKELEIENAELRSNFVNERQMLTEHFNKDLEMVKKQSEEEIQELRSLLHTAQEELEKMRREPNLQEERSLMKNGSVSEATDVSCNPSTNLLQAEEAIKINDLDVCVEKMTSQSTSGDNCNSNSIIEFLEEKVTTLQEEKLKLSVLYETAVADNDVLNRKLLESEQIGRDVNFESTLSSKPTPSMVSTMDDNVQQVKENCLDLVNLDRDTEQPEIAFLESTITELEGENSKLLSMYNSALLDKECLSDELKMYQKFNMQNEDELQHLRSSLLSAKEALQNNTLMHSQFDRSTQEMTESSSQHVGELIESGPGLSESGDENLWSRRQLEEHCTILARMEGKFQEMLQIVEKKFERLQLALDCVSVAAGELGLDDDGFAARIEHVCKDMNVLLSVIDVSSSENQRLHEDLQQAMEKVREDQKAKDDVCLKATVEKVEWMEERSILQEKLDTAVRLCSSKEKVWNDSVEAFQLKLELVEAKLSDLALVVDGTVLAMENQWEGMKKNLYETFFAILKLEKETGYVEDRQHSAELRLKQLENKVRALRKVLDGFSTTKLDWCSREERLHKHVQMLSSALAEKEMETFELKTEEDNFRNCLEQLNRREELLMLEMAAFKEKLQATDQLQVGAVDHCSGRSVPGAFSMLQLLRGQEEKATLLSVITEEEEKMKHIRVDIENMKACIDKKETAVVCAQVEKEAAASSLQEAEAELEEINREKCILLETEAGAETELETLVALHLEAEAEEMKLRKQLESSRQYLQELKDRFADAEQECLPFGHEITDNVQQKKSTVAEKLLETQKCLLDIKGEVLVVGN